MTPRKWWTLFLDKSFCCPAKGPQIHQHYQSLPCNICIQSSLQQKFFLFVSLDIMSSNSSWLSCPVKGRALDQSVGWLVSLRLKFSRNNWFGPPIVFGTFSSSMKSRSSLLIVIAFFPCKGTVEVAPLSPSLLRTLGNQTSPRSCIWIGRWSIHFCWRQGAPSKLIFSETGVGSMVSSFQYAVRARPFKLQYLFSISAIVATGILSFIASTSCFNNAALLPVALHLLFFSLYFSLLTFKQFYVVGFLLLCWCWSCRYKRCFLGVGGLLKL